MSKQGEAKKQFKSRTELFIGPCHHDMMGETYDVRSDVEHLHENKHLKVFDRTARLELVKKLEMMEYIARSALVRSCLNPSYGRTSRIRLRCKRFGRSISSSGVHCGVPPSIRPMLSRSSTRAIFPTISWADPDEHGTSEAQQRWQRIFDWRERAESADTSLPA